MMSGPNTGCFSCRWLLLGTTKLATKKLKSNFFQDKLYFLKTHAHYFTVLIYLVTWRAAKLGIFTHFTSINLPQRSQSINWLICVYYTPTFFYEHFVLAVIALLHTTAGPPKTLYYPLDLRYIHIYDIYIYIYIYIKYLSYISYIIYKPLIWVPKLCVPIIKEKISKLL